MQRSGLQQLIVGIPHYYGPPAPELKLHGSTSAKLQERSAILYRTVMNLHQTFGQSQCMMQINRGATDAANTAYRFKVKVYICAQSHHHLLSQSNLPAWSYDAVIGDTAAVDLGFACHRELARRVNEGDWFAYLEDDLVLNDPLFFEKLQWFTENAGSDALLQPNRFERDSRWLATKAYVDGDLVERCTSDFQNRADRAELWLDYGGARTRFLRPANPHSGCFFLRRDQLMHWMKQPGFGQPDHSFIGPLESAASLGVMQNFRLYKPSIENAGFLEVEHQSTQFISQLRKSDDVNR